MIDAHIHLDQYPHAELDRLIENWKKAGVTEMVAVSTNLESAYRILELQRQYPSFIYAAIGYHPEQTFPTRVEIEEILTLIKMEHHRISGIGEVGIPHYFINDTTTIHKYSELLEEFAAAGVQYDLPLALHAVHDKAEIAYQILKKHHVKKAHFHLLKAPSDIVNQIIEAAITFHSRLKFVTASVIRS